MKFVSFFRSICAVILICLYSVGVSISDDVVATEVKGRTYSVSDISALPDEAKHIDVFVKDGGFDIYTPTKSAGFGYRYGPSIMTNADGSIDAWFAAPGSAGEWDWITYIHSPDGGTSWTKEKAVLQPTPGSVDFYSNCDPGVVFFGGYYYIGYTSTVNKGGIDNNCFVARSKNPDGPYEKWNGSGWGGSPVPIVEYTDNPQYFGAGEPSFVVMGDKLYVYYAWVTQSRETRLSIADATDENWPATLEYSGIAIKHTDDGSDSADVKYIEDCGKFVAVTTSQRMGENSYVAVYESNDGKLFSKSDELKNNISYFCHNSGISSRPDGHIVISDKIYLGYAYGPDWGYWATRMHEINISLSDSLGYAANDETNEKRDIDYAKDELLPVFIGITETEHEAELKVGALYRPAIKAVDTLFSAYTLGFGVKYSGYDESIVEVNAGVFRAISPGETIVIAEWGGFTTELLIKVVPRSGGVC